MISKRLKTIADMIDTSSIIDVGCDHAYLDIYLAKTKGTNCLAIDIRQNIVENCLKLIREEKLEDKITVLLNDGLENIKIKNDDTVVLSGLGTKTIINIIKGKKVTNLIIQSNDDLFELRKYLIKYGYYIADEKIIFDKKYYIIIKFKKGKIKYKKYELMFGPNLIKENNLIFRKYLKKKQNYYQQLIINIPKKYLIRKFKLKKYLKQIKKTLNK